jgi:LisH-like dimerisation domain
MKETVQSQEVVQLLLQFCKEHGMIKTYHSLKEESNLKTNFLRDAAKFPQAFRNGSWDVVLEEMNELSLSRPLLMDFLEHLVFELCEDQEYDLARYIIKDLIIKKST